MTYYERFYDGNYVATRNELIHKAEVKANRNFGKACKEKNNAKASLKWAAQWTKCFAITMEELVTLAGLRNMK